MKLMVITSPPIIYWMQDDCTTKPAVMLATTGSQVSLHLSYGREGARQIWGARQPQLPLPATQEGVHRTGSCAEMQ